MLTATLSQLYQRDLEKLKTEIEQYGSDEQLWSVAGDVANSGGNLTLHLVGNLKHFIGAILGGSGYTRDRDAEFASKGIPRDDILATIDETSEVITATVANLSAEDLAAAYPIEVFGRPMTTEYFLVHLATHLNYHLGQINYHRRLSGS